VLLGDCQKGQDMSACCTLGEKMMLLRLFHFGSSPILEAALL